MKINKCLFVTLIFVFLAKLSFSQVRSVQFEQIDSLQKLEKRPVMVFLHTSWCTYCGLMKNTTLKNKEVIRLLNEAFYFIPLDIEEKKDILYKGYLFKYKPTGANTGINELAEQLGTINGQVAYPGICFLNVKNEILYQHEGYMRDKDLLKILKELKSLASH